MHLNMLFHQNFVNITNENYFSVYVKHIEMASLFRDKVINTNSTITDLEVNLRGRSLLDIMARIHFDPLNDLAYMA